MADQPSSTGPAQVVRQLGELWGRQPKSRKGGAIALVAIVLGAVAWTSLAHHGETWTPLADGSSPDDAAELYATLQARDIPSRLKDGKLEVLESRSDEARAIAAAAGLPHSGKGLELFDGASLGQSSFAEQVNYVRGLQGELARSIAALAQVESARVHLALGKHSVFKEQEQAPSASVALHLHPSQQLTNDQVRGIRQLVAASVDGLKADAVAIVDNHGNLLDSTTTTSTDNKVSIEHGVAERVRSMLEKAAGAGKVSVVATADLDERKTSQTEEIFDKDRQAVRSETRTVEGPDAATSGGLTGGVAGTRGNLPGAPSGGGGGAATGANGKLAETRNYEVTRTVRQTENAAAQLVRLHVAVLVDYKTGADGKPVARDDKELAELTALARQAAGIDDARGDKIEVHSIAFATEVDPFVATPGDVPATAGLPIEMVAAGGGALLLVLMIAGVIVFRRGRKTRLAAQAAELPQLAFPTPVAELERVLEARPSTVSPGLSAADELAALPPGRPVHERVIEHVSADVQRAAEVLTAWLAEPPPKGAKS